LASLTGKRRLPGGTQAKRQLTFFALTSITILPKIWMVFLVGKGHLLLKKLLHFLTSHFFEEKHIVFLGRNNQN